MASKRNLYSFVFPFQMRPGLKAPVSQAVFRLSVHPSVRSSARPYVYNQLSLLEGVSPWKQLSIIYLSLLKVTSATQQHCIRHRNIYNAILHLIRCSYWNLFSTL